MSRTIEQALREFRKLPMKEQKMWKEIVESVCRTPRTSLNHQPGIDRPSSFLKESCARPQGKQAGRPGMI